MLVVCPVLNSSITSLDLVTDSKIWQIWYVGWITNKVVLYSIGNYIQYPATNHHGKEYEKECTYTGHRLVLLVENQPASAGDEDVIPGLERSPGWEHSNPLWYSCLENSLDRGAWQVTVHRDAKSPTWLKWLNRHVLIYMYMHNWVTLLYRRN